MADSRFLLLRMLSWSDQGIIISTGTLDKADTSNVSAAVRVIWGIGQTRKLSAFVYENNKMTVALLL